MATLMWTLDPICVLLFRELLVVIVQNFQLESVSNFGEIVERRNVSVVFLFDGVSHISVSFSCDVCNKTSQCEALLKVTG